MKLKHLHNYLKHAAIIIMSVLALATCQSTTDSDPDENDNVTDDPSKISGNLIFNDGSLKSGSLPANSNLADLKIDKDAVNIWPGIKNRIRILNQGAVPVGGILIQISGAGNYHEVEIENDESSDSISVFYIDVDPSGLDLPIDSDIIIAPVDPNGNIIDVFEDDLHIDTPFEDNNNGSNTNEPSYCKPALDINLHWIYTTVGGALENAPEFPRISSYETMGCCYEGKSSSCLNPNTSVIVDNQWDIISQEVIKFFEGGDFAYTLGRVFNDYDPKGTDFCAGSAGYSYRSSTINTVGTYSMSAANSSETVSKVTIQDYEFDLDDATQHGFGPFTQPNAGVPFLEYFLGCRYYIERSGIEGQDRLRVFEIKPDDDPGWHD